MSLCMHLCVLRSTDVCNQDESKHLKRELLRAKEEVKRIQSVPLTIGQFIEVTRTAAQALERCTA